MMQMIYNHCTIFEDVDSKNIIDVFGLIGPINIKEELKKSPSLKISFDPNQVYIG